MYDRSGASSIIRARVCVQWMTLCAKNTENRVNDEEKHTEQQQQKKRIKTERHRAAV